MSNKSTRIIAMIALLCILISLIGTGILFIFSGNNTNDTELTPEQYEELMNIINSQSGTTNTGDIIDDNIDIDDILDGQNIELNIETGTGTQE